MSEASGVAGGCGKKKVFPTIGPVCPVPQTALIGESAESTRAALLSILEPEEEEDNAAENKL
ncbi:MAG: hypothetical protein DMG14_29555 [Acidobacteria bacterium]|nr:MAG: hypothetical protein DMG14_29555 [Acidobacteriota bacterium]